MQKDHLLSIAHSDWRNLMKDLGASTYREDQLKNWIYKQGEFEFAKMKNLPQNLLTQLEEIYTLQTLQIEKLEQSKDGTCKWVLNTRDNLLIECVLIPEKSRNTVCLSSQVGCGMGCKFCSTAKMGFIRNLTQGEIIEQFLLIQKHLKENSLGAITNIVFMGMGEPLQNALVVRSAADIFADQKLGGVAKKRITVSTSGLPQEIIKWAEAGSGYKLAISLNGVDNSMRSNLMPINKSNSIEKLLEAVEKYSELTGDRITFEYILIKDITCTIPAARALKKLLKEINCKVNLIPLNAGGNDTLTTPSENEMDEFMSVVAAGSFPVMLRKPRGSDIAAACGQLVQNIKKAA